jgi:integrase
MRQEEILSLKWDQVNSRERTIHVRRSKNGRSRVIPVSDEVWAVLGSLPRSLHGSYIFAKADGSRHKWSGLRKTFDATLKRAGIEGFRFHDLRHSFASNLVMAGVDLLTVKELLGHQTISMTVRYAHLAPSHRRGAVLALEKALSGDVAPDVAPNVAR